MEFKDKKFLRVEDADKDYTLVIKGGWKWNGEKVRDWFDDRIGKEEWQTKHMENKVGMMWLIFKDKYVQKYLWRKAERASEERIFTLDELLTAAQRKERWANKAGKEKQLCSRNRTREKNKKNTAKDKSKGRTEENKKQLYILFL